MGRRIEVELTSNKEDGSWTWRAAGAKQPKGDVSEALLYDGAKVGDVVKVEADFHLDGIEITEVFAPRQKKERTDLLAMKSRPLRDDELVTTQRVARSDRQDDRRGGRGRARGEGRRDRDDRGDRGDRSDRGDRGDRRGPRPEADRRPKPKRLRPRRVHRDALLAEVTEEHRPIVEQVIRDGMPGVRAAIEKQNTEAKAAGKPEIDPTPILAIAEKNLAKARLAEWRDRADAALAEGDELDIRDLRSVVVAGTDVARDDESRSLVDQIKTLLDARLESDHANWLADLDVAVTDGRVVRGLRLSSRPVKAGAPLPTEVATKLAEQASQALAPDVAQDRWATVLDALAFSPVRAAVTPIGLPPEPSEELLSEVRRLSDRIPAIATLFGVDPTQVPRSAKRRRSPRREDGRGGPGQQRSQRRDRPVPGAEKKADGPVDQEAEVVPTQAEDSTTVPEVTETAPAPAVAETNGNAETVQTAASETVEVEATAAAAADEAPAEAPAEEAPVAEQAPAAEAAPAEEAPGAEEAPAPAEEQASVAVPAGEPATTASDAAGESQETTEVPTEVPAAAE